MIWESVAWMTVIDLVVVSIASGTLWLILAWRGSHSAPGLLWGSALLAAGMGALAVFHLADLASMFVLPPLIGSAAALEVMEYLHLNVRWLVTLFSLLAFLLGGLSVATRFVELSDEKDRAIRELGEGQDVLRESERAHRGRERWLQTIVDTATEAIISVDRSASIESFNLAASKMFGYSDDEVIGRNVRMLVPSPHAEQHDGYIANYLETGESIIIGRRREVTGRRKDGTEFPMHLVVAETGEGETHRFTAIGWDLTLEKLAEERRLLSQRTEAIGRLAGGIAHDFNNLLAVILGTTELMVARVPKGSAVREGLDNIADTSERAATLIRQLLAFGRQQVLEPQVLDLNQLVARLDPLLRRTIGENIEIDTIHGGGLGSVRADPAQLEQVLLNLVINARDAIFGPGKVTIETGNSYLDRDYADSHPEVNPGRYVMLAVTDDGIGMDGATRRRIFEPYFTTKEEQGGVGLGLATAYGIVKQSGGTISVYSEAGRGTTFKMYLPRVEATPTSAVVESPSVELDFRGRETILIVEDEERLREVVYEMLRTAGYDCVAADSAIHALELFRAQPDRFDLVFTDLVMPGIGGADLIERMREDRPDLRALFMSGYTQNGIVHHGELGPGVRLLQKPFAQRELLRAVREALDEPD